MRELLKKIKLGLQETSQNNKNLSNQQHLILNIQNYQKKAVTKAKQLIFGQLYYS